MNHENFQGDPIVEVLQELRELKKEIVALKSSPPIAPEWIPRSQVMGFFNTVIRKWVLLRKMAI